MNEIHQRFSKSELKAIDSADDLKISPFREDGQTYGTPTWIWEVVVNGELFVRAYNGSGSRWYQAAIQQKAGRIYAAGMVKEVVFEAEEGVVINEGIDEAYRNKYGQSPYMAHMIDKPARQATVRVNPKS